MALILFISTSLPPVADSQTIRNIFLINGLLDGGHRVHLLQPPARTGDPTLKELLRSNVQSTCTDQPFFDALTGRLTLPTRFPALHRLGLRIVSRLAGMISVPDVRAGWDVKAFHSAISEFDSAPDAIVSSSGSNTAHMAARRLALLWKAPWVAEFGDPWSLNPLPPASHSHIRFLNRRIEGRTMRHAAGIVFTTKETAKAFGRQGLAPGVPTEVVPCGFDPSVLDHGKHSGTRPEMVMAYTGTASKGSRDLTPLFTGVADAMRADMSLPPLRIRIAGDVDPAFAGSLESSNRIRVDQLGWLPYRESIRMLSEADVLLLIGNRSDLQIPAKVYNYIASGKPIIYFQQTGEASDPALQLLKKCSNPVLIVGDRKMTPLAVAEFLPAAMLTANATMASVSPHLLSWQEAGNRFAQFVQSCLARRLTANV